MEMFKGIYKGKEQVLIAADTVEEFIELFQEMAEKKRRDKYMTAPELAKYIGISAPNAYKLARRADFPSVVLGEKRIVIITDMVDEWMRKQAAQKAGCRGAMDFEEAAI